MNVCLCLQKPHPKMAASPGRETPYCVSKWITVPTLNLTKRHLKVFLKIVTTIGLHAGHTLCVIDMLFYPRKSQEQNIEHRSPFNKHAAFFGDRRRPMPQWILCSSYRCVLIGNRLGVGEAERTALPWEDNHLPNVHTREILSQSVRLSLSLTGLVPKAVHVSRLQN